jgi:hypothetical protein
MKIVLIALFDQNTFDNCLVKMVRSLATKYELTRNMKIFIAYGFTPQNQWIKDLMYPLVEAHGFEIDNGENVQGESITPAVMDRIKKADGLIGILTKVDQVGNGSWTTRRWVQDELVTARNSRKLFLEVRDNLIDPNRGSLADTQPIEFDESSSKELLIIRLAGVLTRWKQKLRKQHVSLIPLEKTREIYEMRNDPRVSCTYRFMIDLDETEERSARLIQYGEAVCIRVSDFPEEEDVRIDITLKTPDKVYSTGFQPLSILNLKLQ